MIGKLDESIALVEPDRLLILCLYHDSKQADFRSIGEATLQRIQQKFLTKAISLVSLIHGKTANERRGQVGITGQFAGEFSR